MVAVAESPTAPPGDASGQIEPVAFNPQASTGHP